MKVKFFLMLSIVILSCTKTSRTLGQENVIIENDDFYEKCRKLALSDNKIDNEYSFKIISKEIDELYVKYLGYSITTNGDTLKIINSVNYTGLYEDSKKANANIYIYNSENKKLGYYNVGNVLSLPTHLKNGNLIFKYDDDECNQTTLISLIDSIPKKIFINCTEQGGDLYNFQQ